MKTKQLSKNLIIILTLLALIASVFAFSACGKKEFEPKELTIEQGMTAFLIMQWQTQKQQQTFTRMWVKGNFCM